MNGSSDYIAADQVLKDGWWVCSVMVKGAAARRQLVGLLSRSHAVQDIWTYLNCTMVLLIQATEHARKLSNSHQPTTCTDAAE
jgi:hypothetical protein